MEIHPYDFVEVVEANWRRTVCYLVYTGKEAPCAEVLEYETTKINRDIRELPSIQLPDFRPEGSWMAAILFCDGDDSSQMMRWVESLSPEARKRLVVGIHVDADLLLLKDQLRHVGLRGSQQVIFSDRADFHQQFGWKLNCQIYNDAPGEVGLARRHRPKSAS